MAIVCIIQARMGSTRLPGKVLLPLLGITVLEHVYRRVMYSHHISKAVIATTVSPRDLSIAKLCGEKGIPLYLGSEDDVLDRYYQAARLYKADTVVRVTSDCPLIDPDVLDKVIDAHMHSTCAYSSNVAPPTYPDGLDVEVFRFEALERAWNEATLRSDREHVTPYIRKNKDIFSSQNITNAADYSSLRWTLDEMDDFNLISTIYGQLYDSGKIFLMNDVLAFGEANAKLFRMNQKFLRNEGYKKSLAND